jgi:hypothetical protein
MDFNLKFVMQRNRGAIVYAKTADNVTLPVIDITHPAFAVRDDPDSLAALRDTFIASHRRHSRIPRFMTRLLTRLAARRSPLLRAMLASDREYLDSISTYMLKLGANHLPPGFDGPMDRKIASLPHIALVRLRMQQVATLLADALVVPLQDNPGAALHLVNIAGGPALDSINAVILLATARDALLRRPIVIHVLDSQREGPTFGARALAALASAEGPLDGLDMKFRHQPYDWNDTAPLARLLGELAPQGAILAASSEGGLFEYGTDDAITANLTALAAAGVDLVAGSVTSATDIRKQIIAVTKFRLRPRGLAGFEPLAHHGGYAIAETRSAVLSEQVLLRRSASAKSASGAL